MLHGSILRQLDILMNIVWHPAPGIYTVLLKGFVKFHVENDRDAEMREYGQERTGMHLILAPVPTVSTRKASWFFGTNLPSDETK